MSGRDFDARDVEGRPPVAIINETAVRMHFKGGNAVGARVSFNGRQGPWREIVGIVGDSAYAELGEASLPVAYLPVGQNHESGMTLYVAPPSRRHHCSQVCGGRSRNWSRTCPWRASRQ